jgi:hypothetical protein
LNVTEEGLRIYIEKFHSVLETTARENLPAELRERLLHLSLLPARITGYVSTNFGVAIEYISAPQTDIEVIRGSARVEQLILRAPSRYYKRATQLRFAGRSGLSGGTVDGAMPMLVDEQTHAHLHDVCFSSGGEWNRRLHYVDVWGDRSADRWSLHHAVAVAKDEVIAALVELNRAARQEISVDEYITKHKQKTVLLLGDYGAEGSMRLSRISQSLVTLGYVPLLVKDVPDFWDQDLTQKVVTLASISRFVIIDDSSKSGHLVEFQSLKANNFLMIILRAKGHDSSWMTQGVSVHSNVILEREYVANDPAPDVAAACSLAEAKLQAKNTAFQSLYPWRK